MVNSRFKFRAWFNLKNKMVESENLAFQYEGDEENPLVFAFDKTDIDENGNEKGTMNFILMQYTGLKDRNGKEIYEGDIVRIKGHALQRDERGIGINIDGNYVVKWSEKMELILTQSPESEEGWLLSKNLHYIEVIGNIYEHKHLLEGTE